MKPNSIKRISLTYVRGRRSGKQVGDFSWELSRQIKVSLSSGDSVVIPKGFETDLSSIPEFWWGVQKPFGDFLLAPLVHDWMYRNKYNEEELGTYKARLFADKEMLIISKLTNSDKWHNKLDNIVRYWGVRIFGWFTYKKGMKNVIVDSLGISAYGGSAVG